MPSAESMFTARRDHVRAHGMPPNWQPAPAPPPQPLPDQPGTFRVIAFVEPPDRPGAPNVQGLGEQWEARADELAAGGFDALRCWRCGSTVGWTLVDDPEPNERPTWTPVSLVCGVGVTTVSLQCDDCAPAACLEPWPAGVPVGWAAMRPDHCTVAPDGVTSVHVSDPGAVTCRCGSTARRPGPVTA